MSIFHFCHFNICSYKTVFHSIFHCVLPLNQQGLCDVTPEGYHHLTRMLMNLANGRVVIVLEVPCIFYIVFFFSAPLTLHN